MSEALSIERNCSVALGKYVYTGFVASVYLWTVYEIYNFRKLKIVLKECEL
jgi:hypothetical protein